MDRLKILNDFAFLRAMGEKGDEPQLIAFLNAVLKRTGKNTIESVEIIEGRDLPAEIAGDKSAKLDVLAKLAGGVRCNIEVQLKNEHNFEKRTLYYWSKLYIKDFKGGGKYAELKPVITINIIDFDYIPVEDFHTSFHLREDRRKDVQLTDVCEIHFLDLVKYRRLKNKNPADFTMTEPLNRWLIYFDEESSPELIQEVLHMDAAIRLVQDKMEKIARDPALLRTYEQYEKAESDWNSGIYDARQEGEQNKAMAIARAMKAAGEEKHKITMYTGLTAEEIEGIL
jgi:predicted transposase/invertase (TIGR01784 family)